MVDETKPKNEMTRRATFEVAAAVATFGAAMGMLFSPALAQQGQGQGKGDGKGTGGGDGKGGGKGKGEGKGEQ